MSTFTDIIIDFGAKPLGFVTRNWTGAGKLLNKVIINRLINRCRHRPHPWSTAHKYVSWTSLSVKTWSARHLPEDSKDRSRPDIDQLTKFFEREKERLSDKSTLLFPAFAQYLTDGFIRTILLDKNDPRKDDDDRKKNTSNHQLDMSPLYGRTPLQTSVLRLREKDIKGKKGKLKSREIDGEDYPELLYESGDKDAKVKQEFLTKSGEEILDPPLMSDVFKAMPDRMSKIFAVGGDRVNATPQIAMINTLFLREHNRLAGLIELEEPSWDDDHVFEVARNVIIVLFIKLVVEEYVNHIAGFAPAIRLVADPSVAWNASWNKPNWLTTEFSLLYRWHSLIPNNTRWGNTDYEVFDTLMNNNLLIDGGLEKAFADMSAQAAGEIGAFNTARGLLLGFETAAIKQGRFCNLQPYNEYRAYMGLPRCKSFSDVSSKEKVVEFLREKYDHVDDIEFYVGLFAEDLEKNSTLPNLLTRMVAVDAFSQAFTNPLLSEHVWKRKEKTFSKAGWKVINETRTLRHILQRNIKGGLKKDVFIGMTQPSWKRK